MHHEAAFEIAEWLVNAKYEDLTPKAVATAKYSILDTLGVSLAASGLIAACDKVVKMVQDGGGKPESTILGFGGKVPCMMAAYANSAMTHSLDYDDTCGTFHPSQSTFPSALACAEREGNVSGKDFLTAIALGNDLGCRLAMAIETRPKGHKYDWNMTTVMGVFGAAAAAGKMLRLNKDQMIDALGFALHGASGTMAITNDTGNMLRAVYPAQCTISAVLSALMAKNGVTGSRNSLEGKYGLFSIYFENDYNREALLGGLGKQFAVEKIGYKPWPACLASHLYIDGTLSIVREEDLKPDDVTGVTIAVSGYSLNLCEPLDLRQAPGTVMDAKFSIPYIVGCAIARKKVTLRDFTLEGIKDPDALKQAKKVNIRKDDSLGCHPTSTGIVEIKTNNNKTFSRIIKHPYGHPLKPMSEKDIADKFRDCASYVAKPLTKKKIEQIIDTTINLDKVKTIRELVRNLESGIA
jgi:2-methylcitrate dehydratase PrpD